MKIFNKIIFYFNILVIAFTLLSYLSPYINPTKIWIFSFFGLAFPYLVLLNIVLITYWFFFRKRNLVLSLLTLVVGYHYINGFIVFNKSSQKSKNGISILSYNVNQGYFLDKNKIEMKVLPEFLESQNSDIMLLQEMNTKKVETELKKLIKYPFQNIIKGKGAVIFSKFPIISKGEVDFNSTTNSCLWADVVIKNDTIRIYSVHFMSNQISRPAEAILNDMENDRKLKSRNVRMILAKYKRFVQIRAQQVLKVTEHIAQSPYRVIIGGDFNDPPTTFTYNKFIDSFQDAFREKGNGLGITYFGVIPLLRIDYLFFSDKIAINEFETIKVKYSDHFPIKAFFSIH